MSFVDGGIIGVGVMFILQRFHCERPGRVLLLIWGAIVVIAGIEAVLMMYGELWANGNVS